MKGSSTMTMSRSSELSLALASYQWDPAVALVKSKPALARTFSVRLGFFEGRQASTCLPLHEASTGVAPVEVAKAILDAYPDAAQCPESAYQRLPLHTACRRNANPIIVQLILDSYPRGALVPDSLGRLPLHYALSNGADPLIVNALVEKAPDACRGTDNRGWTPLHVACSVGATLPVIERLLELYPEAVVFRTDKGSSPSALIPKECSFRTEVREILKRARLDFDRDFVNPFMAEAKKAEDLMIV